MPNPSLFREMKPSKELQWSEKLGEGAYGCVYRCKLPNTDTVVAVKLIPLGPDQEGLSSTTTREITILQNLKHDNIIRLLQFKIDYDNPLPRVELLFQYMDEDLAKRLKSVRRFQPACVKSVLRQILEGVEYMHQKKVYHRDLKPQNILINKMGVVKIADFGLGRIVGNRLSVMSKEIETLWYRAPELLLGTVKYDYSIDVWSIGCIFHEIAEGEVRFQTESEIGQIIEILKQCGTPRIEEWEQVMELPNFKPTFPKFEKKPRKYQNLSPLGVQLLERMLEVNPRNRIDVSTALKHPYFNE